MQAVMHLITTIDRGGAEKQLLILSNEQVRSGRKVTIVPLKGSNELEFEFTQSGCVVDNSILNLNPLLQLIKFRRLNLDPNLIIHAHLPRAELLGAFGKHGHKLIISKHVTEKFVQGLRGILLSRFFSLFVTRRADHFIAISNAVLNFITYNRELSVKTPSSVIYYGCQKNNSLPKVSADNMESAWVGIDNFTIGTVARLVNQKDIPTLLLSFQKLQESLPGSMLKILGRGILEKELKTFASNLDVEAGSIEWINHEADVFNFLNQLDVFVLTSKYEGFGLVLLEAMQANIPIVASRIPPIEEVLGEEFPNLCTVGDYNLFSAKILAMLTTDERVKILRIQENRLNLFNPESMVKKIDKVYGGL